jgi:hypothetical protein
MTAKYIVPRSGVATARYQKTNLNEAVRGTLQTKRAGPGECALHFPELCRMASRSVGTAGQQVSSMAARLLQIKLLFRRNAGFTDDAPAMLT